MEVKLENLIEKLKKEGVDAAQKESDKIVNKAQKDADQIIADAQKKASKILEDAKQQTEKFKTNTELALNQAARDSELLLKQNVTELFDRVFKQAVSENLKPDFLQKIILKIIEQWGKDKSIEVILNAQDKKHLEKLLFAGVRKSLKKTVTLKPSSEISHGFQIGLKGEDVYFDFSDESLAELLKLHLNPRIKEILDKA